MITSTPQVSVQPATPPVTCVLGALDVSKTIFIADAAYQVTKITCAWGTAGGAGAAATVEKLTGTTAPGGGTAMQTSAFDLTTTANTVGTATLSGTVASLQLAAGDRLGIKLAGTLTGLVGCCITVSLRRL